MDDVLQLVALVLLPILTYFGGRATAKAQEKDSMSTALNSLADAVGVTSDELKETLQEAAKLRKDYKELERKYDELKRENKVIISENRMIKDIARKLYQNLSPMLRPELTEGEMSLLFDTQELAKKEGE